MPETASLIEAVRAPVSKLLIERDDFDYNFWFPSLAEAKEIYEKGLAEKEKFWFERPRIDYWRNEDAQYLAYGTYSLQDNALVVELRFYDLRDQSQFYSPHNMTLVFGKRYRLLVDELPSLYDRIATEIVTALEKEGRHRRGPK